MKTISEDHRRVTVAVLAAVFALGFWSYPTTVGSQNPGAPSALVKALQGEAEVFWEGQQEEKKLQAGETVQAWNSITTDQNTRLLLQWNNGLVTSQGDFSSIFLAPVQTPEGPRDTVQVIEGIVRVATGQSPRAVAPYSVVTPVAMIEPASFSEPADFIVEVYDPSTTVLTVVAGELKVRGLKGGAPMGTTLSRCQTVYIEEDKDRLEVIESSPEDITRLVRDASIPGAIAAAADSCVRDVAVEPTPAPPRYAEPAPSPTYGYPATPDYYVEEWDTYDYNPYEEIVVLPPRPGIGCVIVVPGIGEFVIPLAAFGGWAYDPAVVQVWAQNFFFERIVYYDSHHLRDWRWRERQLHNTMYLAQLAGNRALLRQARHELDFVNVRTNWLEARIRRLERKVAGFQDHQRRLAPGLPRGLNLNNAIADSFTLPKNLPAVNKFQNRLKTDRDVQGRLINIAGNELGQLRTQLARERNPEKRLAMRNELARFRNDVAQDRLPISPKQTEVKNLVNQLSKEKDPNNQERIQKQLLSRLDRTEPGRVPEALDPSKLNSLKQDLAKFPNPEKRRELEGQVTQLQKSFEARREAEAVGRRAEELTAEAAREKNPQKQQELIGKLKEMSGPLAVVGGAAAGAGAMQLIQQRQQRLEKQVAGEKDKAKQTTLQQSLDELKKRQTELRQQEIQPQRQPGLQHPPEADRQKQLDLKKQEQVERQKQQDEQRALRLRQQQEERDRQLQLKSQPQEERTRQMQLRRQQQEEREKQLQQRRLEQQEQKKPAQSQLELDRLKRQQEQQQQRLQRQESDKQLQQRRLEQQEQKKPPQSQLEPDRLKRQQEQQQQRLQQQESDKQLQQRRLEQEQQRKQADQLKQQEQMRLQGERARQEQLRQQQQQQQQQQLKQQQQQQQQQQLKQQQQQQQQQQLKQQQQQQQQMRQQQQPQQKLREEEEKKRKR